MGDKREILIYIKNRNNANTDIKLRWKRKWKMKCNNADRQTKSKNTDA
jgi:hypothetical protein